MTNAETICTLIYKDGKYEAIDHKKSEVYVCATLNIALLATTAIAREWNEKERGEYDKRRN